MQAVQPAAELRRDLVLVGGGHSHALAIRMWAMNPVAGVRVTLVSPSSHTPYSGMLPGLIAGHYTFEETHIDLARLCQWAGARFVTARVTGLNPGLRRLSIEGRPDIEYDIVSLDIGSEPELDSVPGAREHAVAVKPVAGLWQRWCELEQRLATAPAGSAMRIGVVGGGAGSVELALAMARRLAGRASIALYCGAADIVQNYNRRARRAVLAALAEHAVALHTDARVERVAAAELVLAGGARAGYDALFWCTGASAAPWIAASGLPTDERGFLAVDAALQSPQDERVFAAGDIATQLHDPRPKAGVYAVRQAPILVHNLRAALLGESLRSYRPQRRFLSLLSLGGKTATAERGGFVATGAWVWRWKDRIDRTFMRRFSALQSMLPQRAVALPGSANSDQPVCGGCGAKVGGDALGGALAQLRDRYPGQCCASVEDAAPVPVASGPVWQSIDTLREIVADPWLMGRIAANHALSDLYACGLRPLSALAAVTLPFGSGAMLQRELYQLLAGALTEMAPHNCQLTGGHSMQGHELQLGFVVNGVPLRPDLPVLTKCGAAAGDALILTKPLGTGALFAAHMQLRADGRDIAAAIASMLVSNSAAAQLALQHGASACTDVTGFGLAGHLLEMLGGRLGARLELAEIPLLAGAEAALAGGIASTMHPANVAACGSAVAVCQTLDSARADIVFDPQTSGGLLIAVPAAAAGELCRALNRDGGGAVASIIGEVTALTSAAAIEIV